MALIATKCTQCGANIKVEEENSMATCQYCGAQFKVEKEQQPNKQELYNGENTKIKKKISTTKYLVGTALFSAIAYIVSFLEFPIFPAAPFLKLDFSSVFIALSGFIFGPISGVFSCIIKELICFITKSSTGGVGEIANFLMTTSFILLPTIMYKFRKGFKMVVLTLSTGCFIEVGVSLIVNRFINFPLYMGAGAQSAFNSLWGYIAAFNAIKMVAICVITIILYKRVSALIRKI